MRWDDLFADLEAQLDREQADEFAAEVAERSRTEQGSVWLADRLRGHRGVDLGVRLRDGSTVEGVCRDAAPQWLVLGNGSGQALVPVGAVASVAGLSRVAAPPPGEVLRRLGLTHALRGLARDRVGVRLTLDGGVVAGTIDRVGADHLDVAEHAVGEIRRPSAVRGVRTVATTALLCVHSV